MSAYTPDILMTLSVTLIFAAIFLFGGRIAYRPGQRGRRRFLSFAAGISVGYTFVHVLPALGEMRVPVTEFQAGFHRVFPAYSVYLWTMVGFLIFYGLETLTARPRRIPENCAGDGCGANRWQPWVHIGGFAVYAWLLTYLMVWSGKSTIALYLYAVAMGLHIFLITCNLSSHYQIQYNCRGSFLLALASLLGWASGLALDIPTPILVNLVAVVAGGVILNTAIAEIPKERDGRYWSFLAGAVGYAAVLLILSRFEHDGDFASEKFRSGKYAPGRGALNQRLVNDTLTDKQQTGEQQMNTNIPKGKQTVPGLYVTAKEAFEKWKAEPENVMILDVRTPEEYLFIGHPTMAWKIPVAVQSYEWDAAKGQFPMKLLSDFVSRVSQVAKPGDTIMVMCRSGGRSAIAVNMLAKAGFTNVYQIVDGMEGDAVKDPDSVFLGQRLKNGWKNSGCPWTYKLTPERMLLTEKEKKGNEQ